MDENGLGKFGVSRAAESIDLSFCRYDFAASREFDPRVRRFPSFESFVVFFFVVLLSLKSIDPSYIEL